MTQSAEHSTVGDQPANHRHRRRGTDAETRALSRRGKMARCAPIFRVLAVLLLFLLGQHAGAQSAVEKFTAESCKTVTLISQKLSCGNTVPSDETDIYLSPDTVDRMVWQRLWAALESNAPDEVFDSDSSEAELSTIVSTTPISSQTFAANPFQSRRPMHLMAYLGFGNAVPVDAADVRNVARGTADIAGAGANEYTVTTNGMVATYTVDPAHGHRVVRAQSELKPAESGKVGDHANEAVDMLWNPSPQKVGGVAYFWHQGAARCRDRHEWNAGHIIASSLGGSDDDAGNFVPQHHSGNQGGRWRKAEAIAAGLITMVRKQKNWLGDSRVLDACPPLLRVVIAIIQFDYMYPVGLNSEFLYVPSGGTYTVRLRKECKDRLMPGQGPAERYRSLCQDVHDGVFSFCDFVVQWSNGPGNTIFGDHAIKVGPPVNVDLDPRYHVTPQLF